MSDFSEAKVNHQSVWIASCSQNVLGVAICHFHGNKISSIDPACVAFLDLSSICSTSNPKNQAALFPSLRTNPSFAIFLFVCTFLLWLRHQKCSHQQR